MSLITVFGVNASGKDSIAKVLKKNNPGIFVTSESRLLMYHLGIIKHFDLGTPVTNDDYKALENTTQKKVISITNSKYKETLQEFKSNSGTTILLSHLVFLLHHGDEPIFLNEKDPPFPEFSDGLVNIKSKPEDILDRREADNKKGKRERNHTSLQLIEKHQSLCDKKWSKITQNRDPNTFITVQNNDLEVAVKDVENFINQL